LKPRITDTTSFWLKDGKSQREGEVCYKTLPLDTFKAATQDDGSVVIEGWASTDDVDLANDVIKPSAYESSLDAYMTKHGGKMLFMHDWYGMPIGKFDEAEIRDKGLWVKGRVLPTSDGKNAALLIENGVLNAFSVGFAIKKYEQDEEAQTRTITDLELFEISVVNAGMNPEALFAQVKALQPNEESHKEKVSSDGGGTKRKESSMSLTDKQREAIAAAEKMTIDFPEFQAKTSEDIEKAKKSFDEHQRLLKELQEKHEAVAANLITKGELKEFVDRMGADYAALKESVEKGRRAVGIDAERVSALDFKMRSALMVETDNNGKALTPIDQRKFRLFNMPIKYDGPQGELFKMARDLNDIVVVTDAYMRGLNKSRYDISQLKSYQLLSEIVAILDPEFAKAMYSTGSGVGDDWVPTGFSSQLYDYYRLQAKLESFIPHFDMPTNPFTWPVKSGQATLYRAAEAAVNTPDELTKSEMSTSSTTFTAETFAIATVVSPQLIEDSLVAMVPAIREDTANAAADGYESLIINGDDTATHQDTGKSFTSVNPETYETGLRHLATDCSTTFDTASTATGTGGGDAAFGAKDVRYCRKLMGKYGMKPGEVVYTTSMDGFFHIMNMSEFSQPGTYAAGNTWQTGALDSVDGCPLVVSSNVWNDMNASGIYDGSTKTKTAIIAFNKTAFKIGEKRDMTVEFEKNIRTQQWSLVTSFRKSFQMLPASTEKPVACGYDITS